MARYGPSRGHNTAHGYDAGPPPPFSNSNSGFNVPQYHRMQPYIQPTAAYYPPPGFPHNTTHPSIPPLTDLGFPGVHLRNHVGGNGLPPGYNYIFPSEHTIIHVLRNAHKPWQNDQTIHAIDTSTHTKFYVSVDVNVKEFMKQIGCTHPDEKENVVYEIVEKGNGKWAQGLKLNMDDRDKMKKSLGGYGWNKQRNGNLSAGGRPVVWLWRQTQE